MNAFFVVAVVSDSSLAVIKRVCRIHGQLYGCIFFKEKVFFGLLYFYEIFACLFWN